MSESNYAYIHVYTCTCVYIYIGYIILLQVCWEFEIRVIGSEGSESFNLLFFIIVLHDMLVSTRYVYVYLCTV